MSLDPPNKSGDDTPVFRPLRENPPPTNNHGGECPPRAAIRQLGWDMGMSVTLIKGCCPNLPLSVLSRVSECPNYASGLVTIAIEDCGPALRELVSEYGVILV